MATCGGPARIQHRAVELHDSKLRSWEAVGSRISLRLDAYVHASLGEPGVATGALEVLGSAIRIEPIGEARFVERYPGPG